MRFVRAAAFASMLLACGKKDSPPPPPVVDILPSPQRPDGLQLEGLFLSPDLFTATLSKSLGVDMRFREMLAESLHLTPEIASHFALEKNFAFVLTRTGVDPHYVFVFPLKDGARDSLAKAFKALPLGFPRSDLEAFQTTSTTPQGIVIGHYCQHLIGHENEAKTNFLIVASDLETLRSATDYAVQIVAQKNELEGFVDVWVSHEAIAITAREAIAATVEPWLDSRIVRIHKDRMGEKNPDSPFYLSIESVLRLLRIHWQHVSDAMNDVESARWTAKITGKTLDLSLQIAPIAGGALATWASTSSPGTASILHSTSPPTVFAAMARTTPNDRILCAKDATSAIAESLSTPTSPERQELLLGWVNQASRGSESLVQLAATSYGPQFSTCTSGDSQAKSAFSKTMDEAMSLPALCGVVRASNGRCDVRRDDRAQISSIRVGTFHQNPPVTARWYSASSCDEGPSTDSADFVLQMGPEKSFNEPAAPERDHRALDDVIVALGTDVISAWVVFPSGLASLYDGHRFGGGNDPIALSISKTSRGLSIDLVLSPKAIADAFELLALRPK